jgi:hypothetical protein
MQQQKGKDLANWNWQARRRPADGLQEEAEYLKQVAS